MTKVIIIITWGLCDVIIRAETPSDTVSVIFTWSDKVNTWVRDQTVLTKGGNARLK